MSLYKLSSPTISSTKTNLYTFVAVQIDGWDSTMCASRESSSSPSLSISHSRSSSPSRTVHVSSIFPENNKNQIRIKLKSRVIPSHPRLQIASS